MLDKTTIVSASDMIQATPVAAMNRVVDISDFSSFQDNHSLPNQRLPTRSIEKSRAAEPAHAAVAVPSLERDIHRSRASTLSVEARVNGRALRAAVVPMAPDATRLLEYAPFRHGECRGRSDRRDR
jgi:hypothetical protein